MKYPNGSTPPPGSAPPRTAYTLDEVARSLGVTYEQARAMAHRGDIRSVASGRYIRIPVGALAEYLGIPLRDLAGYMQQPVGQAS